MSTEERSLRPPDEPNANPPAENPPGTVGPPTARAGDADGFVFVPGDAPPAAVPLMRPAQWSGWPDEWNTPNWNSDVHAAADTAWLCIDLNASILASMPPYLTGASDSLDSAWIDNPDPDRYSSWEDFAKQLWWEYQLGEVFVIATARYANGYPARFHVVDQWIVNVELDGQGRRRYAIGGLDVTADILHIRYRSRTGQARGEGPLDAGRSRVIAAEVLTRYATNLAAGGGIPSSVLEHPDELNAQQSADLQAQWIEARLSSLGMPAVLSGGVTWKPTALNPTDMALLDLLTFNECRIASLLGVPPFLAGLPSAGNSMTYSNVSMLFDFHWRAGLRPKAQTVCAGLSAWLTPRGTRLEVNRDDYIRPDAEARARIYEILTRIGAITVEEIRALERYGEMTAPQAVPPIAPPIPPMMPPTSREVPADDTE